MNDLEFSFEESLPERFLAGLDENDTVSAVHLLTVLETEDEESVEEVFEGLLEITAHLDLSELPRPQITGNDGLRLKWESQLSFGPDLTEKLEENDPLRVYLLELAGIPACGDLALLAEELGRKNRQGIRDENLCNRVINLSLSRVAELAFRYTGWGVFLLDLIQEGSLGLWRATESYGGRGADFEDVRDWWIEFYMKKAVIFQARESGTGQKLRSAMEDYRSVDEKLLAELGRNPTVEEIAEAAHMTPETAVLIGKMVENARRLQQATNIPEPEEEEPEEQQAVEDTAYFQTRQRISDMMSGLSELEARVIQLRFGLEGGLPLSPEQTGQKLGLTPGEVVAAEAAALVKMRSK